jgi:hypothetical protein
MFNPLDLFANREENINLKNYHKLLIFFSFCFFFFSLLINQIMLITINRGNQGELCSIVIFRISGRISPQFPYGCKNQLEC